MHSEQERTRTRPRVSRACERCRVKKAKCDGEKPCKRCNLDHAVCSYKVRRRTEPGGGNQRYAGLLLQHHAAITAGLIELYSRLIKGQPWEGSPVEELNGSPSVHSILERLGVIDAEDEYDPSSHVAVESNPVPSAHTKAVREQPPKVRKPSKSTSRKGSQSDRRSNSLRSPVSTATAIAPAPAPSITDTDEQPPSGYLNQVASPSSSGSRSGSVQSAISSWGSESPDLSDDMFITPIPTPATTTESTCPDYQMPIQGYPSFSDCSVPGYAGESMPAPATVLYTSSETATETCTAGYFMDATGGMGLYGWDAVNAGANVVFGSIQPDTGSWDPGVFL